MTCDSAHWLAFWASVAMVIISYTNSELLLLTYNSDCYMLVVVVVVVVVAVVVVIVVVVVVSLAKYSIKYSCVVSPHNISQRFQCNATDNC
jgi:hypothetical protein